MQENSLNSLKCVNVFPCVYGNQALCSTYQNDFDLDILLIRKTVITQPWSYPSLRVVKKQTLKRLSACHDYRRKKWIKFVPW